MHNAIKVKFILSMLLFYTHSFAHYSSYQHDKPYLYIGGQAGIDNLHIKDSHFYNNEDLQIKDTGAAGRFFFGAQASPYFGVEMGLAGYQDVQLSNSKVKFEYSQASLDFLLKLSLPVSNQLSVYVKTGFAEVYLYNITFRSYYETERLSGYDRYDVPMLAIGINYALDTKLSAELGAYRLFSKEDLNITDFYGVGLSYKI